MRAAAEGFPSAWARLSSLAWSLSWARLGWDGRDRVGMTLLSRWAVVRFWAPKKRIGFLLPRHAGGRGGRGGNAALAGGPRRRFGARKGACGFVPRWRGGPGPFPGDAGPSRKE